VSRFVKWLDQSWSTRLFDLRSIIQIWLLLILGLALMNGVVLVTRGLLYYYFQIEFDTPWPWPVSVFFWAHIDWFRIVRLVLALILFAIVMHDHNLITRHPIHTIVYGVILIFGTNMIQGFTHGFTFPINTGGPYGIDYFHDAVKITNPLEFFSNFEQLQPSLLLHSQTHPPGSVLMFYLLVKFFGELSLMGVAIAFVSVLMLVTFFRGLIRTEFGDIPENVRSYATVLLLLVPAIQIYFLACLDAVFSGFMLGAVYFSRRTDPIRSILGTVLFLFLASFLSFGVTFALPLILACELFTHRKITKSAIAICGLTIIWVLIYFACDFNYLGAFLAASKIENPDGFRLICQPATYIATRIENVVTILLFFGPFLWFIFIKGLKILKTDSFRKTWILTLSAIGILGFIFLSGAYKTGETARACMFIYPYLMLPVVAYIVKRRPDEKEQKQIAWLVFTQAVLMQFAGSYIW